MRASPPAEPLCHCKPPADRQSEAARSTSGQVTPVPFSFSEKDVPEPRDAYGVSKWEAEQVLKRIASETGLEAAIFRPPLVYGPGVKANF